MKASMSSLSEEIDIALTLEQIVRLKNESVNGSLNIRNEEDREELQPRKIRLRTCNFPDLDGGPVFIRLKSFPLKAGFERIERYHLFISLEGYSILEEKRKLVDRPSHNAKVTITCRNSDNLPTYLSE